MQSASNLQLYLTNAADRNARDMYLFTSRAVRERRMIAPRGRRVVLQVRKMRDLKCDDGLRGKVVEVKCNK